MLSLRRKHLICQEAIELLTEYLEGTLSMRQCRRLESHLATCLDCSSYLDQFRVTVHLSTNIEPDDLPANAVDELTELYRRWRAGG
jgi:anti-sigma factor RsiW